MKKRVLRIGQPVFVGTNHMFGEHYTFFLVKFDRPDNAVVIGNLPNGLYILYHRGRITKMGSWFNSYIEI